MGPYRYVPVVLLLVAAIALAKRPGDVPLALKGIRRMLGKPPTPAEVRPNPVWKRVLAFLCTLVAFLICAMG